MNAMLLARQMMESNSWRIRCWLCRIALSQVIAVVFPRNDRTSLLVGSNSHHDEQCYLCYIRDHQHILANRSWRGLTFFPSNGNIMLNICFFEYYFVRLKRMSLLLLSMFTWRLTSILRSWCDPDRKYHIIDGKHVDMHKYVEIGHSFHFGFAQIVPEWIDYKRMLYNVHISADRKRFLT